MDSLLFIISVTIPALVGFTVLCIAERRESAFSPLERLALSFPLGAGIISFYLFNIAMLGFGITIVSTIPLFILAGYGILKLYQKRGGLNTCVVYRSGCWTDESLWKKLLIFVFIVLIGWKLSFILFSTITTPPISSDALTCWSYKAKVIYFDRSINMDPGSKSFLGGAFSHYPLGPSLFRVWTALVMGGWHEGYIQMHSFIIVCCLLLLVFTGLREWTSLFVRVLSCYLIVSIPLLFIHTNGYVDIILGYYVTGSFVLLMKWFFARNNASLMISAAFMAMAVFTKNEGLVLYLPVALLILLYYLYRISMEFDKKVKSIMLYGVTVSLLAAPWLVFKLINKITLW